MREPQMEAAIRSDVMTLKTLRLNPVPAGKFYLSLLAWILTLSLLFLGLNSMLYLALYSIGFYYPIISFKLVLIAWGSALFVSFFTSFTVARLVLIGALIKGQLKTALLIKRKCLHFIVLFFLIYGGAYCITTLLIVAGLDYSDLATAHTETWFSIFCLAFPQFLACLVASVVTGFIALIELDRLSLAPLFHVIRDLIKNRGGMESQG